MYRSIYALDLPVLRLLHNVGTADTLVYLRTPRLDEHWFRFLKVILVVILLDLDLAMCT